MVDSLTRIIAQNTIDIQRLQSENVSGTSTVEYGKLYDTMRFTDTISGLTGLVRDSTIANITRCNQSRLLTDEQDFKQSLFFGVTESPAGTITLSATPSTGSFIGQFETYCGSWFYLYWSGTTPASTSITALWLDSSGNSLITSGTTSPLAITGTSTFRQVRPMFILSSSLGGNNPTLGEYTVTYDGSRVNDQGVALV